MSAWKRGAAQLGRTKNKTRGKLIEKTLGAAVLARRKFRDSPGLFGRTFREFSHGMSRFDQTSCYAHLPKGPRIKRRSPFGATKHGSTRGTKRSPLGKSIRQTKQGFGLRKWWLVFLCSLNISLKQGTFNKHTDIVQPMFSVAQGDRGKLGCPLRLCGTNEYNLS